MTVEVRNYTRSCHVRQMKAHVGRDKPASFQRTLLIKETFQRVGPLHVNLLRK